MAGSIDIVLGDEWSTVLTPRERQVALLVTRGLSNKDVAREMGLSEGTVKISRAQHFPQTRRKKPLRAHRSGRRE